MNKRASVVSVFFAITVGACANTQSSSGLNAHDHDNVSTWKVAHSKIGCQGIVPMQCLQVQRVPHGTYDWLYQDIIGFNHQEGFEYTILVSTRTVDNPPADGSSLEYRLIKIIDKKPVYK